MFTSRVPITPTHKIMRSNLCKIMVDVWSVLQAVALKGLICPDVRADLMPFIELMERSEEKAKQEP
jgi:hypothetical protein